MACLELGWGHDRLVSDYRPVPVRAILNAKCSPDKDINRFRFSHSSNAPSPGLV